MAMKDIGIQVINNDKIIILQKKKENMDTAVCIYLNELFILTLYQLYIMYII